VIPVCVKKEVSFWYSPPQSSLNCKDFPIEPTFNKLLKFMKLAEDIRLVFDWIYLGEFTVVIDEENIVIKISNQGRGRITYI
jgi:hypothetical protein